MRVRPFTCVVVFPAVMLASGCVIKLGDGAASSGDNGGTGAGEPTSSAQSLPLPTADGWRVLQAVGVEARFTSTQLVILSRRPRR